MTRTLHDARASICPECHRVVPGDHVEDEEGLHLEKFCPEHGAFSTRIAADHRWLSALQEFAAHSFPASAHQTEVLRGCPSDCGECPSHRQKAAFFLFEITDRCDLDCPICLGKPAASGRFVSPDEMERMASAVLAHAGPEVCVTLGGGEPTIHPRFFDLVAVLKRTGLRDIWVYTNGRRISRDLEFARRLAAEHLYVVLQWDGFRDDVHELLRGRALLEEKRRALAHLRTAGARVGLCPTIAAGINDDQLGDLYRLFVGESSIGTLDIATLAFVGRGATFRAGRERRATAQDVLLGLELQTDGDIRVGDFSPVSLSHPECLQIAYLLAVPGGGFVPLRRFVEPDEYKALLLDTALLRLDSRTESAVRDVVNRLWSSGTRDADSVRGLAALRGVMDSLFPARRAISADERKNCSMDLVKVVLVHSYMDGLNFDVGRSRQCISRTVLPDGRLMPTCAFNVVHRADAAWRT